MKEEKAIATNILMTILTESLLSPREKLLIL